MQNQIIILFQFGIFFSKLNVFIYSHKLVAVDINVSNQRNNQYSFKLSSLHAMWAA